MKALKEAFGGWGWHLATIAVFAGIIALNLAVLAAGVWVIVWVLRATGVLQ